MYQESWVADNKFVAVSDIFDTEAPDDILRVVAD